MSATAQTPKGVGGWATAARWPQRSWTPAMTLAVVLIAELAFFTSQASGFLSTGNLLSAGQVISVFAIVGVGETFALVAGQPDISVGSTIALSGVIMTRLASGGAPAGEAIGVALIAGFAIGLLNGLVVVYLKVNPIVTTLGTYGIARGLAYIISGSSFVATTSSVGDGAFQVLAGSTLGVPRCIWLALLIVLLGYLVLHRTRVGRYAFALGANPTAARELGLPVDRLRILYLTLSGAGAGLAGVVYAAVSSGTAGNGALGYELTVIAAVVMGGAGLTGGTGSMLGTGLGVIALGILANGMNFLGLSIAYDLGIPGLFLLLAVGLDSRRTGGYW